VEPKVHSTWREMSYFVLNTAHKIFARKVDNVTGLVL
jgi:hypothetical protein